jgi:hypothetical protein
VLADPAPERARGERKAAAAKLIADKAALPQVNRFPGGAYAGTGRE